MDPLTISVAVALGQGLYQVGQKIADKAIIEPALEPVTEKLKKWLQRPYRQKEKDNALINAVQTAFAQAGLLIAENGEQSVSEGERLDLERSLSWLEKEDSDALRRQLARAVLTFTDPNAAPPPELMTALGWPRAHPGKLAKLLAALRVELYKLPQWQTPIEYADEAARRGLLFAISQKLARLDNLYVTAQGREAWPVTIARRELSTAEAAAIEERYRHDLVKKWEKQDFRGIVQTKRLLRLPLVDMYSELGLLEINKDTFGRQQEKMLDAAEKERAIAEERRLQDRVSAALGKWQRLVILGKPGSGKSITLKFMTLMLAYGYGATRLGLNTPYIPLMVKLDAFAMALKKDKYLSLDKFLPRHLARAESGRPLEKEFLFWTLDHGAGMILLDGLDEVGVGETPQEGRRLRALTVKRVQTFGDVWCSDDRGNRLVVTSRVEGYWNAPLSEFTHLELSPLRPPDEVRAFLMRWFAAYERFNDPDLAATAAETLAMARVAKLLPPMMAWKSTRRLSTNPLLLTILALIHETVGKLPNRRAELYDICTRTLIESWRAEQTDTTNIQPSSLKWNKIIRIIAELAYWMHETKPGGVVPLEEWERKLQEILVNTGLGAQADELTELFMEYAHKQAGLLVERGGGQYGFFHLTIEEYLAGWWLARQRAQRRRATLATYWDNPVWHEVILLAAGQLGVVDADENRAGDFLMELLAMAPKRPQDAGRPAVLAGRAFADIGLGGVDADTKELVLGTLQRTMQDVDPETGKPHDPPRIPARTRYEAGEALDELGWLPGDLYEWRHCGGLWAMKYPLTNAHVARFMAAKGYENPAYWGGEESEAWQWRVAGSRFLSSEGTDEPEYWRNPRFGQERRGYPAVGISWYEANAIAAWLTKLLERALAGDPELAADERELVAGLMAVNAREIRLPTEAEWVTIAGGLAVENRFPWDDPGGPVTTDKESVLARANVEESNLNGTSPVGMYPQGASRPYGLMDLVGNVWEWTATTYGETGAVLRGGAYWNEWNSGGCGARGWDSRYPSLNRYGCRLVAPVISGS